MRESKTKALFLQAVSRLGPYKLVRLGCLTFVVVEVDGASVTLLPLFHQGFVNLCLVEPGFTSVVRAGTVASSTPGVAVEAIRVPVRMRSRKNNDQALRAAVVGLSSKPSPLAQLAELMKRPLTDI